MKRDEGPLPSGFMNHDYVLTFSIKSAAGLEKLVSLCKGPWQGEEVTAFTWEISNDLNPEQMERQILELWRTATGRRTTIYRTRNESSGSC